MSPDGEPFGDIWHKTKNHQSHDSGTYPGENQPGQIAASQEGNHQEGDEENQRRTEVSHHRQASQAVEGKQHVLHQVLLLEQLFQGGGTYQNEDDFHQLRRLKSEVSDIYPVGGTVLNLTAHQVEGQQKHRRHCHDGPNPLRPIQIPKEEADDEEHQQADDYGYELRECSLRLRGCGNRQADSGHEEGNQLNLKTLSPHRLSGENVHPHHPAQQQNGQ